MNILVINGPNIDMLGIREVNIYGKETYQDLMNMLEEYGDQNEIEFDFVQSQYEGDLIEAIHQYNDYDGIIINPAAYSHYSIAILDAIKIVNIPVVEVHISHVFSRDDFRQNLLTAQGCSTLISGMGFKGYIYAADYINTKEKMFKF